MARASGQAEGVAFGCAVALGRFGAARFLPGCGLWTMGMGVSGGGKGVEAKAVWPSPKVREISNAQRRRTRAGTGRRKGMTEV